MRTCCSCPDEAGLHTPGPRRPLGQPDRLGPGLLSAARLRGPMIRPAAQLPASMRDAERLNLAYSVIERGGCAARNVGRRQGTWMRPVSGTASTVVTP